jgi:alpha-galactosidase
LRADIEIGGQTFGINAAGTPRRLGAGWVVPGSAVVVDHDLGAGRFYRHGWHSWSPARWMDLDRSPVQIGIEERRLLADDPALAEVTGHVGSWVGAVEHQDGEAIVLGALDVDATVEATGSELRGVADGAIDWWIGFGDAEETLRGYAAALAGRLGSDRRDPGRVWCSWYSFYRSISGDQMERVMRGLAGLPFDVFQVDDGWEQGIGDWQPNQAFPEGMKAMAAEIARAGYAPGLWLAPFTGHESSDLFAAHPDWFVADGHGAAVAGSNWGGRFHGLDLTHPQTRDFVARTIETAVSWGFTYLKLDFLYTAAIPGRRHQDVPRQAAYRSGLELVREAAGDATYLLLCGAPIVPSIGIANGLRVGPDVAPYWEEDMNAQFVRDFSAPSARYAISTSLARLWLGDVVALDPDVAYFRSRYNLLTRREQQLLQDLCLVCGFRATSDPPAWLDPEEREALRSFLTEKPAITRLDRYRFMIGDRLVDFSEVSLDQHASSR